MDLWVQSGYQVQFGCNPGLQVNLWQHLALCTLTLASAMAHPPGAQSLDPSALLWSVSQLKSPISRMFWSNQILTFPWQENRARKCLKKPNPSKLRVELTPVHSSKSFNFIILFLKSFPEQACCQLPLRPVACLVQLWQVLQKMYGLLDWSSAATTMPCYTTVAFLLPWDRLFPLMVLSEAVTYTITLPKCTSLGDIA